MRRYREIFVLKNFVAIMSDCRKQLVEDVLNQNSVLYNYLLENNSDTRRHRKQLYELKWLALHWQKCRDFIDKTDFELATRRELLKIFLLWYWEFLKSWDYKPADATFLPAKIQSFDKLIQTEELLQKYSDKLQTDLMIYIKQLNNLIEEAKKQ